MGFFTPFEMPTGAAIPARQVSVADFGAVPGGQVNNTRAFAAAIDHLAALGGGRVEIPGGKWLTGPSGRIICPQCPPCLRACAAIPIPPSCTPISAMISP